VDVHDRGVWYAWTCEGSAGMLLSYEGGWGEAKLCDFYWSA